MSFQIEYTGSLVNNRNVPQVSAASSLVRSTLQTFTAPGDPSGGEFNTGLAITFKPTTADLQDSNPANNAGVYNRVLNDSGGITEYANVINTSSGVWNYAANPFELQYVAGNPALAGTPVTISYSFTIQNTAYPSSSMPPPFEPSGFFQFISTIGIQPFPQQVDLNRFGTFTGSFSGNFAPSASSDAGMAGLVIALGNPYWVTIDYIRITQGSSISVAVSPSTLTEGAPKVGGTSTAITVNTVQDGASAVSGPANKFGLVAADGVTPIASAQYYPPATDSEESYASVTDTKTITASTNNISVEATGLDGEEKIERGSSVLVEDVTHLEENP